MTNNPFEAHGVEYLSPSSINKFRKNPAKWLVNVAGYKDQIYKPAMSYGTAVELGLTKALFFEDTPIDDCVAESSKYLNMIRKKAKKEKHEYNIDDCKERETRIKSTISKVLPTFKEFGVPTHSQKKIELELDFLPIPIIGYIDFLYDDSVRDLKVTKNPPKMKRDWEYQLTVYAKATNQKPFIDCIQSTKTKTEVFTFEVQNIDEHMKDIERIANKMMRLLSLSDNIADVCYLSCIEPDLTNEDWWNEWGTNELIGAKKLFMY